MAYIQDADATQCTSYLSYGLCLSTGVDMKKIVVANSDNRNGMFQFQWNWFQCSTEVLFIQ